MRYRALALLLIEQPLQTPKGVEHMQPRLLYAPDRNRHAANDLHMSLRNTTFFVPLEVCRSHHQYSMTSDVVDLSLRHWTSLET
jgi:hypothetical protein